MFCEVDAGVDGWCETADMPWMLLPPCVIELRNVVICWRCCSMEVGGGPTGIGIGRWPGCDMMTARLHKELERKEGTEGSQGVCEAVNEESRTSNVHC